MSINRMTILGGITQDVTTELIGEKKTPKIELSVATDESRKVGDDWEKETDFHRVIIWGRRCEYVQKWAKKGTQVYIEAKSKTRSWEDNDGKKQYRHEFIVTDIQLVGNRKTREEAEGQQQGGADNFGEPPIDSDLF